MEFGEALKELGLPDSDEEHIYESPTLNEQLARGAPPSKEWQAGAAVLIERAVAYLWHPKSVEGQQALAYLHGRGLTDDTIKKARIGYVPLGKDGKWYIGNFEQWGIDPGQLREDQRAKGGVRVPDGILIPWMEGRTIWKLCIKRPGELMSYGQVMGSSDGSLYNIDSVTADMPAMMVESELCALSVQQEAGDIINCIATGSTPKGRNSSAASDLVAASCVLQSFDADEAGDEASEYWIRRFKPKCIRWRPWKDDETGRFKDPNEILQRTEEFRLFTGYSLRGWVQAGVELAELPSPEDPEEPFKTEEHNSSPPDVEASEQPANGLSDESGKAQRFTFVVSRIEKTVEQRRPYTPVTLPLLPRKACPHEVLVNGRALPCRGRPAEHGWCVGHQKSHELLELGAALGYPEVELSFPTGYRDGQPTTGARIIGESVMGWEAYAECAPEKWLARDITRIRTKYGYYTRSIHL